MHDVAYKGIFGFISDENPCSGVMILGGVIGPDCCKMVENSAVTGKMNVRARALDGRVVTGATDL